MTYFRTSIFFLALFFCATAIADDHIRDGELDSFHESILKMAGPGERAIQPAIAKSKNNLVIEYGAVVNAAVWDRTTIAVCWKNAESVDRQERMWVRDSIEITWQKFSQLKFTGWSACPSGQFAGIRIKIDDVGPHTTTLGRFLEDGDNQMVLNFEFNTWSSDECSAEAQRESCIRSIAVHEFGHAIGFTHEQNRADSPGECKRLAQGSTPNRNLTPYDPDSVMNYCNKTWNNDGFLSTHDIEAVQQLYGKPK